MDVELRTYLEAMEQRTVERFDAMRQENAVAHAETRSAVEAGLRAASGAREVAEAGLSAATGAREMAKAGLRAATGAREMAKAGLRATTGAREMAEAFRGEARILHEDTMQAIGAVVDGLNMLRESVDRRAEDRARDVMDRHIAPLKAMALDHQERITALENRLK